MNPSSDEHQTVWLRRLLWLPLLPLTIALLAGPGLRSADAVASEVRLTGNNANNFFTVTAVSATTLEFCSDVVGCFTRLKAEVATIVIDGFDGDDVVFVSHENGFVTNGEGDLTLTFAGGPGNDELSVCDAFAPCTQALTTTVSRGPEVDELRLVQCLGRGQPGNRCEDVPFPAAPTLKITARGTTQMRDLAPGPVTVLGSAVDDQVTLRASEVFDPHAGDLVGAAELLVGTSSPLRVANKDSLTVATGEGADRIAIDGVAGLSPTPYDCSPDDTAASMRVCINAGGDVGDVLTVAPGIGTPEPVVLAPRPPDAATLTGNAVAPGLDLVGVDAVELAQQPAEGDIFTLIGSTGTDALAWQATSPGVVGLSGQLDVDGSPHPVPAVTITGDSSAPIQLSLDGLDGSDTASLATGAGADTLVVGPAVARPACAASFGTCLEHAIDGVAQHVLVGRAIEAFEMSTGDGADELVVPGDVSPSLTWRAGSGVDRLAFTSAQQAVTVDLAAGTVAETGSTGHVAVTEVEDLQVDAAGRSLTVRGTPGPDTMRYQPETATAGAVTRDGDARTVSARGIAGTLTLDPGDGDDTVVVDGTSAGDTIAIFRGQAVVTQVGDTLPVRAAGTTESLAVNGRAGDDRFVVSGEGGTAAITVDGGVHTGGDRLSFAAAVTSATVAFDAAPASGTLTAGGPPIAFRNLEHVDAEGDGTGTFRVLGSDSADSIVADAATVTVGRGTTASFTQYPILAIDALAGDDDIVVAPRTLGPGVTDVAVDGGDAGSDTLAIMGSELRETIAYEPTGAFAGSVELSLSPLVTFTGIESVEVDGRTAPPAGDTLLLRSPGVAGTIVAAPGTAVDAGTLSLADATGSITSFPPLHYARLGRGDVVVNGADADGVATDRVLVRGEPDADVFVLTADGATATVVLDSRVPLSTNAVHAVALHGLDGQDTFHLPAAHGLPGAGGPAIVIDGGGPSGGDVAVVTGAGGALSADLAASTLTHAGSQPVAFAGLDRIDLHAAGGATSVLGGGAPDLVTVRPTAADAAEITTDLTPTRLLLAGAAALTVDTGAGADVLAVVARSVADDILVERGPTSTVTVAGLLGVTVADTVEALRVEGREGGDTMTVTGGGGPASLALDGGLPAADGDRVVLVDADVAVGFADPATSGMLSSGGGDVAFAGFDTVDVRGDGNGTLVVRGTDAPDTITVGDLGAPAVRVNNGARVEYTGYPTLVLDGRGGSDGIAISYANLGNITRLEAAGGTAADDDVTITDTLGATRRFDVRPLDSDHASIDATGDVPTVAVTGGRGVTINGRDGDDEIRVLTPAGAQDVLVQPGPTTDAGTVRVGSLIPVTFTAIGVDGLLGVNDPGFPAEDHVVLAGTDNADTFGLTGVDAEVRRTGFVKLRADGASRLTLRGLAGNDTFTANGPLPWATTTLEGGGPDVGDAVVLDGPVGDAVVDIGTASVTGYGGVVRFPEVSALRTSHAHLGLALIGSDRDDAICYDPQAPRDGRAHIVAAPAGGTLSDSCLGDPRALDVLHEFVDVGHLVMDPGPGADQVIVNGTVNDDAVTIESTGPEVVVAVNPNPLSTEGVRLPVHVVTASTENLVVSTDNGQDEIDVRLHEAPAPVITVHGEAPDSRRADSLIVRDLSGGANINNIGGDPQSSGTVVTEWRRFSGHEVRVVYTGIEWVRIYKSQRPKGA